MSDELFAPKPALKMPKKIEKAIRKEAEKRARAEGEARASKEENVALRRVVRDLSEGTREAAAAPAVAAPPPPAPLSKRAEYMLLKQTNPYAAAQFLDWYQSEIVSEAQAERAGGEK